MENTSLWERRKVMVKRKMKTTLLITIMLLSMTIGTSVQAAGCSDYKLSAKGTAQCTNKLCPGGLKRKERQDLYKQTCVRADGSIYYNQDYRTVYVSCSCL